MPTTKIYINDIESYLGINLKKFIDIVPYIGMEIDQIDVDSIKLEYTSNRLDYGFPTGVFKSIEGILDIETGIIKYTKKKGPNYFYIYVDPNMHNVRPYIGGVVIKNVSLSDRMVEYIINFQEDLHNTIGRGRRKVSIGIHNFDKIKFPIKYTLKNKEYSFIPLNYDREMSIQEILETHEKGRKYGYIVQNSEWGYPILEDASGQTLSFPPIINSQHTQIDENTRNLFIDVTGTDENSINDTINLLSTALSDIGGEIYIVTSVYPHKEVEYPKLNYRKITIDANECREILGIDLDKHLIIKSLRRMRYDANEKRGKIEVTIPPYRIDILHPIDIIEDVSIGYGYWNITPTLTDIYFSEPKRLSMIEFVNKIEDILMGLGFIQVMNMMLINREVQTKYLNKTMNVVTVMDPKTKRNTLRAWLTPSILETISINLAEKYPLKVFEIGYVIEKDLREKWKLCVAIGDYKVNYMDIKSVVDTLFKLLGINNKVDFIEIDEEFLIKGRAAKIIANGKNIGFLGEIHPEILLNFKIDIPIAISEIYLEEVMNIYQEKL